MAGIPEGPSRTLERVADGGGIDIGHRVPAVPRADIPHGRTDAGGIGLRIVQLCTQRWA